MPDKQRGFAVVEMLVVFAVVVVAGVAGYSVLRKNDAPKELTSAISDSHQQIQEFEELVNSSPTPVPLKVNNPVKIKHLGVNIDYYDPGTKMAGDFKFTKAILHDAMIFMNYGYVIPGDSTSTGLDKKNPQPTFIVPLGTKVHSLVDGTVFAVTKLYSNDYSVQVQASGSDLIFETEHVLNVVVKQGDSVSAGDVVAEVSNHDSQYNAGMGLVEIGVLKGGNPPSHLCPFDYLDDSIKEDMLKKITALQESWEEYRGDRSIYDESKVVVPGCVTRDPIEG